MTLLVNESYKVKKKINVSQHKYILDLLIEIDILGYKPSDIPIEVGKKSKDLGKSIDKERYQRLVEKLIYLSHIRPDIACAIS